jgi:probable HAF family extracellular repeat protein
VATLLLGSSELRAAPSYQVRDLLGFPGDDPIGDQNRALGVNAGGEITGQARTPGGFTYQGFRTLPGGTIVTSTPLPGTIGEDINVRGEIAGWVLSPSFIATLTVGTVTTKLGDFASPLGASSQAFGLNGLQLGPGQLPQVVGLSNLPGEAYYHAFLWQSGATNGVPGNPQLRDLGSIVAPEVAGLYPYDLSHAWAISDAQQVVGWSTSHVRAAYVQGNPTMRHAFLWTAGGTLGPPENPEMRDLGTLGVDSPGLENHSEAHDINNLGQITGFSTTIGGPTGTSFGHSHAFLWSEGTGMVDLDPNAERSTNGMALNNHGDVVGVMTAGGNNRAFIHTEGQVWDLNDLIPPNSGWVLLEAHDINDSGEIVGWGIHDGAFRPFALTGPPPPAVPGPFGWKLVLLGVLLASGLGWRVARRAA